MYLINVTDGDKIHDLTYNDTGKGIMIVSWKDELFRYNKDDPDGAYYHTLRESNDGIEIVSPLRVDLSYFVSKLCIINGMLIVYNYVDNKSIQLNRPWSISICAPWGDKEESLATWFMGIVPKKIGLGEEGYEYFPDEIVHVFTKDGIERESTDKFVATALGRILMYTFCAISKLVSYDSVSCDASIPEILPELIKTMEKVDK